MNEFNIFLLLRTIQQNTGIGTLIKHHLSYSQIGMLIRETNKLGLVGFVDKELKLTDEGKTILTTYEKRFKNTNKQDWIQKDIESIIPQIGIDEVFLPSQVELLYLYIDPREAQAQPDLEQ